MVWQNSWAGTSWPVRGVQSNHAPAEPWAWHIINDGRFADFERGKADEQHERRASFSRRLSAGEAKMNLTVDQLLEQALNLPGEERLHLAEALLSSVSPAGALPFDAEWLTEAKRRAARIDAGEGKTSSWAEVRERARRALEGQADG
jgi:putative addiction module component (TIGR02574 family)